MKHMRILAAALGVVFLFAAFAGLPLFQTTAPRPTGAPDDRPKPLPAFIEKGMAWLAEAQFENGGWGAGTHALQDVRDPHAVQVDPATTAFAAMALMRSGGTLTRGPYHENVGQALEYLLDLVETYPEEGVHITDVAGTQPQAKLGQHIDVPMVAQFFTQVLPFTGHDAGLRDRVAGALETCVTKLARAQDADGSWNSRGGWAGVLQSAMANNALEMAQEAGLDVDGEVLDRSRRYQQGNVDAAAGVVRTESAAGVSLYAVSSNQRATAKEAREAEEAVAGGVHDGRLEKPTVSVDNLRKLGYADDAARQLVQAYRTNQAAAEMLRSDEVLAGFGNNGGEEFLSYMMTSEALAMAGGEEWDAWYRKMHDRLGTIQNPDGSWSGHHCITSPVFCTAAVILTMTADRAVKA